MTKRKILFIGDSLTWCQKPNSSEREEENKRWTTMLKNHYPDVDFCFFGLPGLGASIDPWGNPIFNSEKLLSQIIYASWPLDEIYLFFGINNLLSVKNINLDNNEIAEQIIASFNEVKSIVRFLKQKVSDYEVEINFIGIPKSQAIQRDIDEFNILIKQHCLLKNINFINNNELVINSQDHIHFDEKANRDFFEIIKKWVL